MKTKSCHVELNFGELPTLPSGWRWGQMANAATDEKNAIVDGPFGSNLKLNDYIDPPGIPVLTTANLRGDYGPSSVRYISQSKFNQLKRSEVRGGDILVAKIGSCGLTGVYPEGMPSAIIPANLLKITVRKDFSRKFIFHYLNSPVFSQFLNKIITATAQPAFNVTKFRMLPLPLVSKQQQTTLVAEIEKQLARLEAGVAALKRVQANLKRYRAAVLKAACEGRLVPTEADLARKEGRTYETGRQLLTRILTERRRNWQGCGKYIEPASPDAKNLPPIPEGWTWATLEALGEALGGCAFESKKFSTKGYQVLKMANIRIGQIDLTQRPSFIEDITPEQLKKFTLREGDLVVTLTGTRKKRDYGYVAVVKTQSGLLLNQRIARLRPFPDVIPAFLQLEMQTEHYRDSFFSHETGNVGQGNVGMAAVTKETITLPPLAEQKRIVAEVERRLSVIEEQETMVSASLRRAARLRQSILQQAFEGHLVPVTNDEDQAI